MNKSYVYKINPEMDLSKQYISKEANAILICLFRDYFATEKQKKILNNLLTQNQEKIENIKKEKYNSDNIFKNKNINTNGIKEQQALVEIKKEKWYEKIFSVLKMIFKK